MLLQSNEVLSGRSGKFTRAAIEAIRGQIESANA